MNKPILAAVACLIFATSSTLAAETGPTTHKGWWIGYHAVTEENVCFHEAGGCSDFPKPPKITPKNSVLGGFVTGSKGLGFLRIDTASFDNDHSVDDIGVFSNGAGKLDLRLHRQGSSGTWLPQVAPGPGWTMKWDGYNGALVFENDEQPYYRRATIKFDYLEPNTAGATQAKSE